MYSGRVAEAAQGLVTSSMLELTRPLSSLQISVAYAPDLNGQRICTYVLFSIKWCRMHLCGYLSYTHSFHLCRRAVPSWSLNPSRRIMPLQRLIPSRNRSTTNRLLCQSGGLLHSVGPSKRTMPLQKLIPSRSKKHTYLASLLEGWIKAYLFKRNSLLNKLILKGTPYY